MLKIVHEGFKLELPNISRYKVGTNHRYLILSLLDGEVDEIFTSNGSLDKAKKDIDDYYGFMYGEISYHCVAYIKN